MSDFTLLKARAKINIALDIIGKRADGYHNLKMIMQTTNLYDTLFIKKTDTQTIELKTNIHWIPANKNNLVYKAAESLREIFNIKEGIFIELDKNIPVAAGLGGGSADCAAALVGIRNIFKLPASNSELCEIGLKLGADVPYCIRRGTVLAEGTGGILTNIPSFPLVHILLAKPPISVSTALVYNEYDKIENPNIIKHPDIEKIIYYIKKKNLRKICDNIENVLEAVTAEKYEIINQIKKTMLEHKAVGALMSGSGPTVFGLFYSKRDAIEALKAVKRNCGVRECCVTNVFNTRYIN